MKTIVIDAGHGGHSPGAVNGTRREKNDNLNLALAVQRKLQQQGQRAILTRSTDIYLTLEERSAISNRNNADLFISIHRNAFANPAANGVENIVYTNAAPRTIQYAQNVLNEIVSVGVQSNRGIKKGNFAVLKDTKAPAMLLELGFITNTIDNDLFDRNFDAYATAITRGILKSLGEAYYPPIVTPPPTVDPVIASIQRTLNERYNTGLVVDGIVGSITRRALIIALQLELNRTFNAGLLVDGVIGPKTRAAIPNLRVGSRGHLVYLLQAALYIRGYNVGSLDGIFGPITQAAVRDFQRSRGLAVDGIAGPNTISTLLTA